MRITLPLFLLLLSAPIMLSAQETTSKPVSSSLNKQPVKTVIDFLRWYANHQDELNNFVLVGEKKSTTNSSDPVPNYRVNFYETEKWLTKLESSGFLSTAFLTSQREYFASCDNDFLNTPVNEGPPEGFDADLIMLSQDYSLNNLEKSKATIQWNGKTKAQVIIDFSYNEQRLLYDLSQQAGKWKIDKISDGRQ